MSWETKKLGDICELAYGKGLQKIDRCEKGDFPAFGANGIKTRTNKWLYDKPSIIIGRKGSAGELNCVTGKFWALDVSYYVTYDEKILNIRFLYYMLSAQNLPKLAKGVKPGINRNDVYSLIISLPPLNEQRAIVGKIDVMFENIDKAVKLEQCNARNAEALFKKSLGVTYKSNWSNTTELEKLTKITSSKRIYKSDYVKKGIPFYRIKEIKELANKKEITKKLFISEDKFKKIKEKFGVPKEGDILLTAVGTIGEVYVVKLKDKFYFKDGNVLWLKDIKHIDSEFLRYSILSFVDGLNNMSQGTAHSALTIEKLKKHHITMPSKEEQLNIVNRLDNLLSTCNMLKKICETKAKQLSGLKTSLLRQMLIESSEVVA